MCLLPKNINIKKLKKLVSSKGTVTERRLYNCANIAEQTPLRGFWIKYWICSSVMKGQPERETVADCYAYRVYLSGRIYVEIKREILLTSCKLYVVYWIVHLFDDNMTTIWFFFFLLNSVHLQQYCAFISMYCPICLTYCLFFVSKWLKFGN